MAAGKSCYPLSLFDKLGVHFLYCVGQSRALGRGISTQVYNSFVDFCLLENVEEFMISRKVCEFCRKVVLPAGKSQPETYKLIIEFSLKFPFLVMIKNIFSLGQLN